MQFDDESFVTGKVEENAAAWVMIIIDTSWTNWLRIDPSCRVEDTEQFLWWLYAMNDKSSWLNVLCDIICNLFFQKRKLRNIKCAISYSCEQKVERNWKYFRHI